MLTMPASQQTTTNTVRKYKSFNLNTNKQKFKYHQNIKKKNRWNKFMKINIHN